jgi:glycosyltransferase involved in cell wall biosynthesis
MSDGNAAACRRPQPDISVVVPCYNAAGFVREAVGSLQQQSLSSWEAICVDDGSRDGTADVLMELAREEPRLRVASAAHGGVSAARNLGVRLSRAERVLFLDADDVLRPHALERLLGAADGAGPQIIVTGGYELLDASGRPLGVTFQPSAAHFSVPELLTAVRITVTTLVPRGLLGSRPFDESLSVHEDWELWLRLAADGVGCVVVPEVIFGYRMRPSSACHQFDGHFAAARKMLERWESAADAGIQNDELRKTNRTASRLAHNSVYCHRRDAETSHDRRDAEASRRIHHRLAWAFGSIAMVAGDRSAIVRYLHELEPMDYDEPLLRDVAGSLRWAFLFVRGAYGETWRTHRTEWLEHSRRWLGDGPLARWAGFVLEHLAAITVDPCERLAQIESWLLQRQPRRVVLYGMGSNGRAWLERLRAAGWAERWALAGADDAADQGSFDRLALERDDPRGWRGWPDSTVVLVTPDEFEPLRRRLAAAGGHEGTDFLVLARPAPRMGSAGVPPSARTPSEGSAGVSPAMRTPRARSPGVQPLAGIQNGECRIQNEAPAAPPEFVIRHSSFCIRTRASRPQSERQARGDSET